MMHRRFASLVPEKRCYLNFERWARRWCWWRNVTSEEILMFGNWVRWGGIGVNFVAKNTSFQEKDSILSIF